MFREFGQQKFSSDLLLNQTLVLDLIPGLLRQHLILFSTEFVVSELVFVLSFLDAGLELDWVDQGGVREILK